MNRATADKLDALRLQLEAQSGIDDKYVPPPFIPADELPYFKRHVPLPSGFYDLTRGLPATPGSADIFIDKLKSTVDLGAAYLREIREILNRKGQFDSVKKALTAAERDYESALKTLNRAVGEMKQTQVVLRRVVDETDKIAKGSGEIVYPKGKP